MSKPWSARRAVMAMHRAYSGWDASDPSVAIDEQHLARAYLAGIKALIADVEARMPGVRLCAERSREFLASERARLLGRRQP